MKKKIYLKNSINVYCVCGHCFNIFSNIINDIHIDICNKCHPIFIGKKKNKKIKINKYESIYKDLF